MNRHARHVVDSGAGRTAREATVPLGPNGSPERLPRQAAWSSATNWMNWIRWERAFGLGLRSKRHASSEFLSRMVVGRRNVFEQLWSILNLFVFGFWWCLHYTTLHSTTLHYITLHYTTFHYTSLHYITLHSTTLQLQLQLHNYTPISKRTLLINWNPLFKKSETFRGPKNKHPGVN